MRIALLINDRGSRKDLVKALATPGVVIDEYPTAQKSLAKLATVHYDLIVIHWQVHPGLKPAHPRIKRIGVALRKTKLNRNALYWEVGLNVMDAIRAEGSQNVAAPVVVIFPDLGRTRFDAGNRLSEDRVNADLATRQPASVISDILTEEIAEELRQRMRAAKTKSPSQGQT